MKGLYNETVSPSAGICSVPLFRASQPGLRGLHGCRRRLAGNRRLGINDNVVGLWAGAMLAVLGYWTIAWFEKKNWRFAGRDFWLIALSVAMIGFVYRDMLTYSPQIFLFLYIDPFLLSAVAGALMFIASMQLYGRMKTKNGGHAHFPFEKVVLPLTFLTAASAAINYYPY